VNRNKKSVSQTGRLYDPPERSRRATPVAKSVEPPPKAISVRQVSLFPIIAAVLGGVLIGGVLVTAAVILVARPLLSQDASDRANVPKKQIPIAQDFNLLKSNPPTPQEPPATVPEPNPPPDPVGAATNRQKNQTPSQPQLPKPPDPPAPQITLLDFEAQDGTFTAKLPRGWKVKSATWRDYLAEGPNNECVFCQTRELPGTRQAQAVMKGGLHSQRRAGLITQEKYDSLLRYYSFEPLPPARILTDFIPAIKPEIVQMEILDSNEPDGITYEGMGVGMKAKEFHYSYANMKRGGEKMRGVSQITTTDPPGQGGYKWWSFTIFGFEAPETLFNDHNNQRLYSSLRSSYRPNPDVIRQRIQEERAKDERLAGQIRESAEKFRQASENLRQTMQKNHEKMMEVLSRSVVPSSVRSAVH
jgi:hypothetical protein